jgi:nitrite reductase (NADH) large subunit
VAGAGVAGVTAAETARQENPKADITVFGLERDALYFRPRLPEIVSGRLTTDKIFAHPDAWYREKNLELRKGEHLAEVSLEDRMVRGSLGSRLLFDRLLLAVGAESSRPAPVNYALPGVFTVRNLNDAMALHYETKRCRTAVLMGAGLLALEIAAALAAAGLKVHVLERAERILPRQTTPASSARLNELLTAQGLTFRLNASLAAATGVERLQRVELSDGSVIEAQLLVVAAGVTPNLNLAKALGLKIDRAIVVDQFLETSVPNVYAAGDCAQTPDGLGGLWTVARQQGLIAGRNLAVAPQDRRPYAPQPPSSTLKVAGVDLVAAGDLDPGDRLRSATAQSSAIYRKVVVDSDGLVIGYTNLGTVKGNRELAGALKRKRLPEAWLAELADPEFDFGKIQALPEA